MVDKKKKVLFKIPSEEEIQKAAPPAPIQEPKEIPEDLPISEPAPVAEVDGAKAKAERKAKTEEARAKRAGPGPMPERRTRKAAKVSRYLGLNKSFNPEVMDAHRQLIARFYAVHTDCRNC